MSIQLFLLVFAFVGSEVKSTEGKQTITITIYNILTQNLRA